MSEFNRITDAEIEAYLDQQMSPEQRRLFELRLALDPITQESLAERKKMEETLRNDFEPPALSVDEIDVWLPDERKTVPTPWWQRRLVQACLVIAASVAWLIVCWQWGAPSKLEPFFAPRSLAQIYEETVSQGFRPYYVCDDETRFAQTFAKRQVVPLRLLPMPPSRRMLGLSYLGGLSRDTTAMLCYVDKKPVMVFVDRGEFGQNAILNVRDESTLFIHPSTLGDLVLYEVTPIAEPMVMEFLEIARDQGS